MKRNILVLLTFLIIGLLVPWSLFGQSNSDPATSVKSLQKGSEIWTGTGLISHRKDFQAQNNGYETIRNTEIGVDVKYIKLIRSNIGLGIRSFGSIFISGGFESAGAGTIAIGPVAQYYLHNGNEFNFYVEGSYLLGYNLTLNDAAGSTDSNDSRFRSSLRVGGAYRFTNNLGVFVEVGPDWEGDFPGFETNAKAIQLSIGIQLFKF